MNETPRPKTVWASSTCGLVAPDGVRSRLAIVSAIAAGLVPSTSCTSHPNASQRARAGVHHVLRVAERLLAVDVDQRDEVAEAVVRGEHRRLPYRALVALGVAQQGEH